MKKKLYEIQLEGFEYEVFNVFNAKINTRRNFQNVSFGYKNYLLPTKVSFNWNIKKNCLKCLLMVMKYYFLLFLMEILYLENFEKVSESLCFVSVA